MSTATDVNQDVRAALLVAVFNALPDVMLLVRHVGDANYELIAASAHAGDALGVPALREGDRLVANAGNAPIDKVITQIAAATADGVVPEDVATAGGVVLEGRAVALVDDAQVVWVGRNVTAERIAQHAADDREVQLHQLNTDLGRSNRDLAQFAYSASHDLSEPLRTVSSFVELLARRYEGKLDDRAQEYIGFAVDGVQRMRTLIEDLLAVAALRSEPAPADIVDLEVVASAAWADTAVAANDAEATIEIGALPMVRGAENELRQVFQNLFANAIKFRREGGITISVSAEVVDSMCRISVTDNGIGIIAQHRERVFDMFTRLHPRAQYPGTGIGLALCRQIVERHGGEIWIDPTITEGTRVIFTCPTAGPTSRETP